MLPSVHKLCLEDPLYSSYSPSDDEISTLHDLLQLSQQLDAYCEGCKQDTVITGGSARIDWQTMRYIPNEALIISKEFRCSRNPDHRFCFIFRWHKTALTKIGQFPSKATLDEAKIKEYKDVLNGQFMKEFVRAIGLASHGVGIGSFVYLRRIFERLIEEAHLKVKE